MVIYGIIFGGMLPITYVLMGTEDTHNARYL